MRIVEVRIKGISPLLHHRYVFKNELEVNSKKRSGVIDYSHEWLKALYWSEEIGVYQPASHLEGSLIKAAADFKIPGRRGKSYKDIFKSGIFVKPDYIPFGFKGNPEKLLAEGKFSIDRRAEVVNKARVERLRPIFQDWQLKFQLEVHHEQIPDDVIQEILTHAGRFCGIGDRRPRYGRFMVTEFRAN